MLNVCVVGGAQSRWVENGSHIVWHKTGIVIVVYKENFMPKLPWYVQKVDCLIPVSLMAKV